MALTQTDIDNLSAQYKTLKALAKSDFVAAVNAAKVPADLDIPKQTFHKALDDLEDLNDFINAEQEMVDASADGSDTSDDSTTDNEADDTASAQVSAPAAETASTPPATESPQTAPADATGTAPAETVATDPASTTPPGSNTPPAA